MSTIAEKLNEVIKLSQSDLRAADAMITEIINNNPESSPQLMILAFIKSLQGQYQNAIKALLKNNNLYPGSAISFFNLGYCYRQTNQFKKACRALEKAADLSDRKEIPIMTLLGSTYHQIGNLNSAREIFKQVLAINPESLFGLFYLLQLSKETNDFNQAVELQERITKILDNNPESTPPIVEFISRYDYFEWQKTNDKGSLSKLIRSVQSTHYNFYPETYLIPEEYAEIEKKHKDSKKTWIIKPRSLMGGQGISLINDVRKIPLEEGLIVQEYINNPLLIEEKKFNMRLYLLFKSINPMSCYIWKNGIIFIAAEKYKSSKEDLSKTSAHIVNPLQSMEHADRVAPIDLESQETSNFRTLDSLLQSLEKQGIDTNRLWNNITNLSKNVKDMIINSGLLNKIIQSSLHYSHAPKFIGLDVLIDQDLNPHLMEIEQYPGLSGLNAVTKHLNHQFMSDLMHLLCDPVSLEISDAEGMTKDQWTKLEEKAFEKNSYNFEIIS